MNRGPYRWPSVLCARAMAKAVDGNDDEIERRIALRQAGAT
jgi:hypothetical protein